MSDFVLMILSLGLLFLFLAAGMKIGWALGLSGLIVIVDRFGTNGLMMIASHGWDKGNAFVLTCLPLFLFMGEMILRSGLNIMVFDGMERLTKGISGEALHTTVGCCAVFAAASGSSIACAATVSSIAYDELTRRGYPRELTLGTLAAGGTLGVLIPPSFAFIIYGALVGESISKLFISGFIPGVILAGMFSTYIFILAKIKAQGFPSAGKFHPILNLSGLRKMWPVALLVALVMGTIYTGVATPTEAAALGAVGSIFVTFLFRRPLLLQAIYEASLSTVKTTAMVMFIIIGASVFTFAMTHIGVTDAVKAGILSLGLSRIYVFIGVCVVYLILGMFLDGTSMLVLSLPIFYPILMELGYDSIWLGVVIVVLMEVALLTPPVGFNLFVIQGMTKRPLGEVFKGTMPFIFIMFLMVIILYAFPNLALWLPSLTSK